MKRTILLAALLATAPAMAADYMPAVPAAASGHLAYRPVFAAIRAGDFVAAAAAIDAHPDPELTPIARAELLLAQGAASADGTAVGALLTGTPDLPEAAALTVLARQQGVAVPPLPVTHELIRYAGASKRAGIRPARGGTAIAARLTPLVRANDGAGAEAALDAATATLPVDALTEWRGRIAWAYLLAGDDGNARRIATLASGGEGEWTAQGDWIAGLAGWRSQDFTAAALAFSALASRSRDMETMAAGLFWSARAELAAGRAEIASAGFRSAARTGDTFYGMIAAAVLGQSDAPADEGSLPDVLQSCHNARVAAALSEIGETALADQVIRYQARIGDPSHHEALIRLAERLDLPQTQVWLAGNGPAGGSGSLASRYPTPAWAPSGGWRVDRALLMAHALQESRFRNDAVSPAGARGLMQLMPGTARLVAKRRGESADTMPALDDPATSLEYGQSYLEQLAQGSATNGQLPKVIAAYNAGPNNVAAWALRPGTSDDPLLFIETIPFAETRVYVTSVLRNYWMYQRRAGVAAESLAVLAQNKWPIFPTAARAPLQTARAEPAVAISVR